MREFFKKIAKQTNFEILIIFLLGLITFTWFTKGHMVWGVDAAFPIKLDGYTNVYFSFITSKAALSSPDASKFPFLMPLGLILQGVRMLHIPFNPILFQQILIYVLFASSGLSAWYLAKSLFPDSSPWARILAASFYMFNLYSFFVWSTLSWLIFFYAFFPLLLALFIKGLKEERSLLYFSGLALLWTLLITPSYITPPFAVITWFVLLLYLAFYLLQNRSAEKFRKSIKSTAWLLLSWTALNLFWIIPQGMYFQNEFVRRAVDVDPLSLIQYNSTPISSLFRFIGPEFLKAQYKDVTVYPWYSTYGSALFILIGIGILILALSSLFSKRRKKDLFFFLALMLLFVFLLTGLQSPLKPLSKLIFTHFDLAAVFRSLWMRFMGVTILCVAILLCVSTDRLTGFLSRFKRQNMLKPLSIGIIFLIVVGLYGFPVWTNKVFPQSEGILVSQKIKFPDEYYSTADWLNSQEGDFAVLPLPFPTMGVAQLDWQGGKDGYSGMYPLYLLSNKRFVLSGFGSGISDEVLGFLVKGELKDASILSNLNIRYLVFNRDADWKYIEDDNWFISGSPNIMNQVLNNLYGLKRVQTFGNIDIFENTFWNDNSYAYSPRKIFTIDQPDQIMQADYSTNYLFGEGGSFILEGDGSNPLAARAIMPFVDLENNDAPQPGIFRGVVNNIAVDGPAKLYLEKRATDALSLAASRNLITIQERPKGEVKLNGSPLDLNTTNDTTQVRRRAGFEYFVLCDGKLWQLGTSTTISLPAAANSVLIFSRPIGTADLLNLAAPASNQEEIVPVRGGSNYILSFAYHGSWNNTLSYSLTFDDPAHTVVTKRLARSGWNMLQFVTSVQAPEGASSVRIRLIFPENPEQEDIGNYQQYGFRDLRFFNVSSEMDDSLSGFHTLDVQLQKGENSFEFTSAGQGNQALVQNPRFENGTADWELVDAFNYDNNPDINMTVDKSDAEHGNSLELEARRHIAAARTVVSPIDPGQQYSLSFDYKCEAGNQAGYALEFNDPDKTLITQSISAEDSNWHDYSKMIRPPYGATYFNLYFYTFAQDDINLSVNLYDNVSVDEFPGGMENTLLLASDPAPLVQPPAIDAQEISATRKEVHVSHAPGPFTLALNEGYSTGWHVVGGKGGMFDYLLGHLGLSNAYEPLETGHFALDGSINGFTLDPASLIDKGVSHANQDGTYDMDFIVEFLPQQTLNYAFLLSIIFFLAFAIWLSIAFYKRRSARNGLEQD